VIIRLLAVLLLLAGCQSTRYAVLAATGTNIGVEVSQNPATQSPQAKLGYQRSEFAIVPTNRSGDVSSKDSHGQGAVDLADVVMELRYGGIFDLGPTSGIYQRLAVGKDGVNQPGASFMFAKDAGGRLDPATAAEVAKAHAAVQTISAPSAAVESEKAVLRVKREALRGNAAEIAKFDIAAKAAGYADFDTFLVATPSSLEKARLIRQSLEAQGVRF